MRGEQHVGLRGQRLAPLPPRTGEGLYLAVGEDKTIRVGDNLQEYVHAVKNGGESRVLAIVICELGSGEGGVREQRGRAGQARHLLHWTNGCLPSTFLCGHCFWMGGRGQGFCGPWIPMHYQVRAPSPPQAHLLCKPDPSGLGDPLPGMDA